MGRILDKKNRQPCMCRSQNLELSTNQQYPTQKIRNCQQMNNTQNQESGINHK